MSIRLNATKGLLAFALSCCWTLGAGGISAAAEPAPQALAKRILDATGVKGGLVVHVACGDGKLTAALRANDSYIVHGLDASEKNVAAARKHIQSLKLYGPVSVRLWDGAALPYADNLVNLLVAEDLGKPGAPGMAEVMRVLAPLGVAYIGGKKTVKPRPKEIDEWSHFLHDASNNAVANDTVVGPPRRLQWTAGPPWCRSHEFISSFCAMVSAGGRVFYVVDLGQPGVTDKRLPERWTLFARDAFNGVLLWKRPLAKWRADEWRGTAMRGRPPSVPRRIVAGNDRLYATLSHRGKLAVIEPATGKTLQEIDGTEGTQEIALVGKALVLRLDRADDKAAAIAAVEADSGKIRWKVPAGRYQSQSLAANNGRVVYSDSVETICLDLANGKELWRSGGAKPKPKPGQRPKRRRRGDRTLIIHGGLVLECDGGSIVARDAKTGRGRWTTRTGGGSMRGHDFFIARGLAWHAAGGGIAGYDLKTGKVARTIDPSKVQSRGHHLRCYRSKATERFLITQFRGTEFVSLTDDNHSQNDWTRGPCRYGVMPCNGMLYVPPHQCFCYAGATMTGLNAYTTASDGELKAIGQSPLPNRLRRGPAYGAIRPSAGSGQAIRNEDWPMYRHDERRTGATACQIPAKIDKRWQIELGGRLTPPVAAGARVYVAAKDRHTLYALGDKDGKEAWRFTANAGIDSPPTIYQGRVLFGCADGWLYCLRVSDGALAWRFRAAPAERLIVAESRVESAWRVHGSVIVHDGVVYFTAGRSSFLNGGLFLYGLNPKTGKVVHEGRLHTLMATREDAVGKGFLTSFHIQGTRSDLLVAEGGYIYVNQMKFTPDLKPAKTRYVPHDPKDTTSGMDVAGKGYVEENPYLKKGFASAAALGVRRGHMGDQEVGLHLFSTGGFLDDSWFNRTFWMYAKTWPGYQIAHIAPKAGQLLVIGDKTTYAVQAYPTRNVHSPMFTPAAKGYLLIADSNDNEPMLDHRSWARDKGMGFTRKNPPKWHQWVAIRMRAMVLAKDTLFVAGAPDVLDPKDPYAAFQGRKGAMLQAFSAQDGSKLGQYKLPDEPVFDGLIAAGGRLYLTTRNGRVLCLGK